MKNNPQAFILGASLTTAFLVFSAGWFALSPYLLACYLFFLAACCAWLSQSMPSFRLYFFLALILVVWSISPVVSWQLQIEKALYIFLLGVTLAFFHLLLQYGGQAILLKKYAVLSVCEMQRLTEIIFSCFLNADYKDKKMMYEKKLHEKKNNMLQALLSLQKIVEKKNQAVRPEKNAALLLAEYLERWYVYLMGAAFLRLRMTDHSTFGLCQNELSEIAAAIHACFEQIILCLQTRKWQRGELEAAVRSLTIALQRFEENAQRILQVAAPQPMVFLPFMASIQSLQTSFILFCQQIRT